MTGKEWSGTLTTLDAGGKRGAGNTFSLESDEVHTCSHLDLSIVLLEGTKFVMLWKWTQRRTRMASILLVMEKEPQTAHPFNKDPA